MSLLSSHFDVFLHALLKTIIKNEIKYVVCRLLIKFIVDIIITNKLADLLQDKY